MPSEPLLDPELAQLLRANRRRVVAFAGAGVTASAGLPSAKRLAVMIAERAKERGAYLVPREDFNGVCAEVSDQLGHDELQQIVSEIIGVVTVGPTPLLTRIAHAPSQIVVTTNYDYGLEAAAREIGREPVTLHPRSALVTAAPTAGQLLVVHIHGVHDELESIVLPVAVCRRSKRTSPSRPPFVCCSLRTSFSISATASPTPTTICATRSSGSATTSPTLVSTRSFFQRMSTRSV